MIALAVSVLYVLSLVYIGVGIIVLIASIITLKTAFYIVWILAAIAIPRFVNMRREARRAACQGSLGSIRAALTNYYAWYAMNSAHYNGYYPASIHDLDAYFQGLTVPADPGWLQNAAGQGHLITANPDWDDWYTSGTIGVISDNACCINNF